MRFTSESMLNNVRLHTLSSFYKANRDPMTYGTNRWLSLPMELLLRMLALLDEQELMTARLVCPYWRQASLTYMTHLNLNAWLQNSGVGASTASLEALEKCSQVLPNLSNLTYRIKSPREALLLSLPSCASALKRLHIEFTDSDCSVGAVAVAMAPIARLTGLTLFSADAPRRNSRAAPAEHAQFMCSTCVILMQCIRLCKVVLYRCEVEEWLLLLPFLAGLPHLQILGNLPLCNQDVVAGIASMTQLTSVLGRDEEGEDLQLRPLLRLPALRALDLAVLDDRVWPKLVPATTQGIVQLAHLAIHGLGDCNFCLGALLAPLSGLTKLEIFAGPFRPLPHYLWQPSLGNLQDFRWSAADVSGGEVALPLSLRHLELELQHWDGPEMPGLIQRVAALTHLTTLSLSVVFPYIGWTTDGGANAAWRAAGFVTGLTRLIHLNLDHFLHVDNMKGDVESLAVLTGLRRLRLRGSCSCHGGDEHDLGRELYWHEEGSVQGSANDCCQCTDSKWSVQACGFEAFERGGGFLRLLPLAGLKHVEADGPWQVLVGSGFAAEVNAVRRVAGRPPLNFCRLSELGVWPGWEGRMHCI